MILLALLLAGRLGGSIAFAADSQIESPLIVRAVRFYRADVHQTRVKGLVQIPMAVISPPDSPNGATSYSVSVRVADSTGLTLYSQSWRNRVPPGVAGRTGYTVEIFDFAVADGQYRLDVAIEDSLSGRKLSTSAPITALSDSSAASDLLIAPQMRVVDQSDTMPRPGEFRTGDNLVTAAAQVTLTPLRSKVFYLMEAYTASEEKGSMTVTVAGSNGAQLTKTPAVPITVAAGGSVLRGQLDLTGLPPGTYTLNADVKLGEKNVRRSANLVMADLGEALERDTAMRAEARVTDAGYFAEMTPAQLETAKAPLIYLAESRELSVWNSSLSVPAKRRFLAEFWAKRDPTPGTPRNERREAFYQAIDYANQAFREGGRRPQSGWRSDRGRIYAKYGVPEQTYKRQQEGRAAPYEVWSYSKGKGAYYIFADRSGFGAYTLIYSNDLKEPGLPGWGELLGAPAVEDISHWLGIDLVEAARKGN